VSYILLRYFAFSDNYYDQVSVLKSLVANNDTGAGVTGVADTVREREDACHG